MKRITRTLGTALLLAAFAAAPAIPSRAAGPAPSDPSASPHPTAQPDEIGGSGQPATSSSTPAPNEKARVTTQARSPVVGLSRHDAMFVRDEQMRILYETQAGRLGKKSGSSPEVREFSEKIVTDSGSASNRLKVVAMSDNIAAPARLDDEHQKMVDDLSKARGKVFDRTFTAQMVHISDQALASFKKARGKTANEDLKTFIVETTPALEKRWKGSKELEKSVGAE